MSIPHKKTSYLIEEIPTDGHSPLKFMCDDGDIYYCKYRVSHKKQEIDCLIYEVVCNALLQALKIPTPEIAIVEILEGSYSEDDLRRNRPFIKPNILCFGSKEVKNAQLVTELDKISTEQDFKSYENPEDLIRIALFDLWVGNMDRGKGGSDFEPGRSYNYNLLTAPHKQKTRIYAFDHGFTFEGENGLRIFNSSFMPNTSNKLFGTQFFQDFANYFSIERMAELIEQFITLIESLDITSLIAEVFSELPEEWKDFDPLQDKIVNYLTDRQRIETLKDLAGKNLIERRS